MPTNSMDTIDETRAWGAPDAAEIRRRADADPVVILPVAATEQHGPHLPASTDVDIGQGLLREACQRLDPDLPAWLLPMEGVGASLEHTRFAGATSVSAGELAETIYGHGERLAAHGIRRLLVSNSHGGNRAAVDIAALRLRAAHDLLVVKAHYFRLAPPTALDLPEAEWRHGLHGGAVETSMMLHLCPERVQTGEIRPFESLGAELEANGSRVGPTGPAAFAWLAGDLNRAGVAGDATLATAEIGRRLVTHYATWLAETIRDTQRFPIDRLAAMDQ